jgi:hypothetical protein
MPLDDRAAKVSDKCAEHPGRQAVDVCEACGRPLCVACAVPVRGRVVGVECVASVLGELQQPSPERGWGRAELLAGSGLALVVIASVLPWTRFGVGSAFLGGWDGVPSWSLLASSSGVVAFAMWWSIARKGGRGAEVVALAGGVVAAAAAFLALIHPPPFTKPWIGMAAALLGGIAAAVGGAIEVRRRLRVR